MSLAKRVFITPIYQRILGTAIQYVIAHMNEGDSYRTWEALKTLFLSCPDEVQKECEEDVKKIQDQLARKTARKNLDSLQSKLSTDQELFGFLRENNYNLYGKIMASLFKHNYLEQKQRELPLGVQKGLNEEEELEVTT